MNLKFKNRIALFNTLAVAFITALIFLVIYAVVHRTAYSHLDANIAFERAEVIGNLNWAGDSIIINQMPEWDEAEHSQIEVNPTFLQIEDKNGSVIFRSANLLYNQLLEDRDQKTDIYYNGKINGKNIRLGQFLIINNEDKVIGRLIIAVSQQESVTILRNLMWVLFVSFPLVLIVQFFASSVAASGAISPVLRLIHSASQINESNISSRLDLPKHKDELFELTWTINELLSRIEDSMVRQKQFTSDASHEIRTPLSAIRGTLEVLIRRNREPIVYQERITEVINQVDRLEALLEQLLQLARIDTANSPINPEAISLLQLCNGLTEKWKSQAIEKNIKINLNLSEDLFVRGDHFFLEIIIDNLVNNAIKYGKENGNVFISWNENLKSLLVEDDGIGILSENLPHIFNRFYRADGSRSSVIKGNGLGLSIVKKLADIQQIKLNANSTIERGSTFSLQFSS